jgi:hypothetical protein
MASLTGRFTLLAATETAQATWRRCDKTFFLSPLTVGTNFG